jgi:hypothetical protein
MSPVANRLIAYLSPQAVQPSEAIVHLVVGIYSNSPYQ